MITLGYMFKDNYKYLLRTTGKSYSDVARFCKVSPQTARDWDVKGSLPRPERMEKLALFFGVPVDQMQYGNLDGAPDFVPKRGKNLPLVYLNELDEFFEHGHDSKRVFHCTYDVKDEAFSIVQEGDSMVNGSAGVSIPDGAIVIVEPADEFKPQSIVLARMQDTGIYTIKRLVTDAGKSYLSPINQMYSSIIVDENVKIVGVAKYSITEKAL